MGMDGINGFGPIVQPVQPQVKTQIKDQSQAQSEVVNYEANAQAQAMDLTVEAADKVVVLKDGRVAEEGSPAELKVRPGSIFSRMLTLQTEGAGWSI